MKLREQARHWHEEMLAAAEDGPAHGTRWGIGAGAIGPSVAAVRRHLGK